MAPAADGQPHLPLQLREVLTAPILYLDPLEQIPDALIGIEFGCVAGQALQAEAARGARGEEVLHRRAMVDGRAVPNHEQLAADLAEQLPEEGRNRRTAERMGLHVGEEPAVGDNGANRGEVIARERGAQDGRLPHGGIGAHHERQQIVGRLVYDEDRVSLLPGFS
jgi:hypothetical protein